MDMCCSVADIAGTPRSHHETKEKRSSGNDTKEGNQKMTVPGEAHPRMDSGRRITTGGREIQPKTGADGKR